MAAYGTSESGSLDFERSMTLESFKRSCLIIYQKATKFEISSSARILASRSSKFPVKSKASTQQLRNSSELPPNE